VLNDNLRIRAATEQDCEAIHHLLQTLAAAVGETDKLISEPRHIREYGFSDAPLFQALLAEKDGQAIGLCLYFYTFSTWLGTPGVYVQDLVIDPSARGLGIGRSLLAETAAIGRNRGANHLRLIVYDDNTEAQQFYEKIGMRHRPEECVYQADGKVFTEFADAGSGS
jgi:ribosomal protein S18 acetylase RimI-like enzyme